MSGKAVPFREGINQTGGCASDQFEAQPHELR